MIQACFTCDSRVTHVLSWSLWYWHPLLIACGPTKFPIDCYLVSSCLCCAARACVPLVLVIQVCFTRASHVTHVCVTCDSRVIHVFSSSLWCWHPFLIARGPKHFHIDCYRLSSFLVCARNTTCEPLVLVIQAYFTCDSRVIHV